MTNILQNDESTGSRLEAGPAETETVTKLQAEIGRLEGELRMRGARDILLPRLRDAGARSPELLFASVSDKLQFSDDGGVANAAALIESLKNDLPEQFATVQPGASIDAATGARGEARPLTKAALASMEPAQIAKLDWAAVREALSHA